MLDLGLEDLRVRPCALVLLFRSTWHEQRIENTLGDLTYSMPSLPGSIGWASREGCSKALSHLFTSHSVHSSSKMCRLKSLLHTLCNNISHLPLLFRGTTSEKLPKIWHSTLTKSPSYRTRINHTPHFSNTNSRTITPHQWLMGIQGRGFKRNSKTLPTDDKRIPRSCPSAALDRRVKAKYTQLS
jgi:hypothetical protein